MAKASGNAFAPPPKGLTATLEGGKPRLNWQAPAPAPAVFRYLIFRALGGTIAGAQELVAVIGTTTTFLDTSAATDTTYTYSVKAQYDDADGPISPDSDPATITTPPGADASIGPGSVLPVCGDQGDGTAVLNCVLFSQLANLQMYQVPSGATLLTFDIVYRTAVFNNEIAIFKVDDANRTIDGMHPGDAGYLAAALNRAEVVFPSGNTASSADFTRTVAAGDLLAILVVQNDTLANLKASNPGNSPSGSPIAFFSINSLNPDGLDHVVAFQMGAITEFGFEDLTGGGDLDYDDLVITVTPGSPIP